MNSPEYAIVHPGSGDSSLNLNAEQYILIIRLLLENTSWTVLLTSISEEGNLVNEIPAGFSEEQVKKQQDVFHWQNYFL